MRECDHCHQQVSVIVEVLNNGVAEYWCAECFVDPECLRDADQD